MSLYERIASSLIGTPVQGLAEGVRSVKALPWRLRHPELRELHLEHGRSKQVLDQTIKPGMNCIDIGCHLGSVLDRFAKLSPQGKHIAIEPIPYKAEWLRKKYPGVEVHQNALGDEEKVLTFFFDPKNSGFSGLKDHGGGEKQTFEVLCKRLDDVVPPDRRIGFIKLDVEGAEYYVFRGARRVMAESRPIIYFECTRSGLHAFDIPPERVHELVTGELGYRIYLIKDWLAGGSPLDASAFARSMTYPFQAFNYIAAPAPER